MTELDIERERLEFYEACEAHGVVRNDGPFDGWLLAKRSVLGSAEPVAFVDVADSYEGPYKFDGLELLPVGKHLLYTAPPAPVSADKIRSDALEVAAQLCESDCTGHRHTTGDSVRRNLAVRIRSAKSSAPPSTDAKDGEKTYVISQKMINAGMSWLTHFHHMRKGDKESALEEAYKAMTHQQSQDAAITKKESP